MGQGRVRGFGAVALACMLCVLPHTALAQGNQSPQIVGIDGVPKAFVQVTALSTGDVLLVPPPKNQKRGRPMHRVLAADATYQIDPIVFGNPDWSAIRIDDAVEAPDQTLWAIGGNSVVYLARGGSWQMIEMPDLNRSHCKKWGSFGVGCQVIVPIADDRAVVLRPRYQAGVLSTEVYAIQQGEQRPLGSVVLPGIALGPAVQDGSGGFWVMLRSMVRTSNYKPMRGYLHYTAEGEWLMWSDSGESVEGTEYRGKTPFLIDPNARKMTPDGNGGFFAIGRDRVVYHVDNQGVAKPFSDAQPKCSYCQPMAIDFDDFSGQLHLVVSEWREGEAGKIEIMGETQWLRFDGATGSLVSSEPIPLPDVAMKRARAVFDGMHVAAVPGGVWIAAPGMLFHRDNREWHWLTDTAKAQEQEMTNLQKEREARINPGRAMLGTGGNLALAAATGGGAMLTGLSRKARRNSLLGPSVLTETPGFVAFGAWGLGTVAAYYPALFTYPGLGQDQIRGPGRGLRLLGGGLVSTAAAGLSVWFFGESIAWSAENGGETSSFNGTAPSLGAAMGGAAIGTVASMALMKLTLDHGDPAKLEQNFAFQAGVGAAVIAGMSTLAYVLFADRWQTDYDSGLIPR